ncbi:hypothetical protein ACIKQA_19095, partial [Acinetobacter baumannii]|uniref:hypothetical protein n=1 Tax=Acinetobacter baumannii TaxID=470 RepID=UPI0037CEF3A3
VGKNALPPGEDQDKYFEDLRAAFKAEYDYPIIYTDDKKLEGIKVGFRFTNRGIPLNMVDKILNRIKSAFNVQ